LKQHHLLHPIAASSNGASDIGIAGDHVVFAGMEKEEQHDPGQVNEGLAASCGEMGPRGVGHDEAEEMGFDPGSVRSGTMWPIG